MTSPEAPAGGRPYRTVINAFGELRIPFFASDSRSVIGSKGVELTLAMRTEGYSNGEDGRSAWTWNPLYGLRWAPISALALRAAYSTAINYPTLSQLNEPNSAMLLPLPGRGEDSLVNTLILFGGNDALRPEEAETITAGFDVVWPGHPNTMVAVTYYDVHTHNRVLMPPVQEHLPQIFGSDDQFAAFIDLAPDPASVRKIYAQYPVVDPVGIGTAGIAAIVDARYSNSAEIHSQGVEFEGRYGFEWSGNRIQFEMQGRYVDELRYKASSTAQAVELAGTIYNPTRYRLSIGAGWARGPVASSMVFHTQSPSSNPSVPEQSLGAWRTLDAHVRVEPGRFARLPFLADTEIWLSVLNVADRSPPVLRGPNSVGYDALNSSVDGRSYELRWTYRW